MKRALAAVAGYFLKHWRGEHSLAVSFWVNKALAAAATVLMTWPLLQLLAWLEVETMYGWYYLWAWAVTVALTTWACVGIWRSAEARPQGDGSFWTNAAKGMVVLNIIIGVVSFAHLDYPSIKDGFAYAELLRGLDGEIRVQPDGKSLELAGAVGFGFAGRVTQALDRNPGVTTVYTNLYRGGLLGEAKILAAELRRRRLTTQVSGGCVSACTVVFLGGERRVMLGWARLGFHQPSIPGPAFLIDAIVSWREAAYLAAQGVEKEFAEKAMAVESEAMWYPEPSELVDAGVADEITYEQSGAPEGAPLESDRKNTERALDALRVYRALKTVEPETYSRIVDIYVNETASGGADYIPLRVSPLIIAAYQRRRAFADDAVISRTGALVADQLRALRRKSLEGCKAVAKGETLPPGTWDKHLSAELKDREQELIAETLETAVKAGSRRGAAKALERARANARFRVGTKDECENLITVYEELVTLPPAEGAPGIRVLLGH